MQSVAILDPDVALALMEFLRTQGIPCQTQTITEESGLDASQVLVEDTIYDQALEVAEKWEQMLAAEAKAKSARACPKCQASAALERVKDEHYEEMGLIVFRCQKCGESFPL